MKKLDIISTKIRVDSLSWLYSLLIRLISYLAQFFFQFLNFQFSVQFKGSSVWLQFLVAVSQVPLFDLSFNLVTEFFA